MTGGNAARDKGTPAVPPPAKYRLRVNGVQLAFFEWRPDLRGRAAPLLFAHATGFHARIWDQTIRHLGDRYVISVDLRSHGRSDKVEIRHWNVFGQDLAALVRELDLRDVIGIGHSMGGHAMTDAASACAGRFERLLLVDPVIVSPADYEEGGQRFIELLGGEMHPTARRKNRFASPEEMFERFHRRPPYSLFQPAALRDYCRYGLLPAEDGNGYVLACPPEIEASIYMTSRTNGDVYDSVRSIGVPVTILRAKSPPPDRSAMDFESSPTWPGLVGEFKNARVLQLADRTHFLPMEAPELVARHV